MFRFSLFILLLFPLAGWSQTDLFSKDKVEKTDQAIYAEGAQDSIRVLIIPFEEKLFYCDIMRDLTTTNNLNSEQIFNRFRNAIQLSLRSALSDSMETATFLNTDSITDQELISIYSQLGYAYMPIPVKEEEDPPAGRTGKKEKKTKKKKTDPKEKKAEVGIRNGQVIAERDNIPRYMNAKLKDLNMLEQLHANYGINRFLFINQMDVKMDLSDPETAFLDPRRVVALHYTIIDKDGKQLSGGLAEERFAATENNINRIVSDTFYNLALEVVDALRPVKEKEKENPSAGRAGKKKRKSKTDLKE